MAAEENRRVDYDVVFELTSGARPAPYAREGMLKVLDQGQKAAWKKRFVAMDAHMLHVFKSNKEVAPIESVPLASVHQVTTDAFDRKASKNCIQLHTSLSTVHLQADSAEDLDAWVHALRTNVECVQSGSAAFEQRLWPARVDKARGVRGGANLLELFGKRLTHASAHIFSSTVGTTVKSWNLDTCDINVDMAAESLTIRSVAAAASPVAAAESELFTVTFTDVDPTGQGGIRLLEQLAGGVKKNQLLRSTAGFVSTYPVRFKRGALTVAIGMQDPRPLWVEVSGSRLSIFDKPESPLPLDEMVLRDVTISCQYIVDEKAPDRIVVRPVAGGANPKAAITFSGPAISSKAPTSLQNRLEWVVALQENVSRASAEPQFSEIAENCRRKRGFAKYGMQRVWLELDELALRVLPQPKSTRALQTYLLTMIDHVATNGNSMVVTTGWGESISLELERLASEWTYGLEHNMEQLKKLLRPVGVVVSAATGSPATTAAAAAAAAAAAPTPEAGSAAASASDRPSVDKFVGAEIALNEMTMLNKLGDGCFGEVYRGMCRSKEVAIKVPLVQELDETQLEALRKEIALMSANPHPNIALFMGACTVPGNFRIVTELMDGDLDTLLKRTKEPFSLFQRLVMARDAVLGMCWLHHSKPQIVHRDLKTANLLYKKHGTQYVVKVCDFGLSAVKPGVQSLKDQGGAKGTPLYMAPEVMLQEEFDEKADIYSFGIVMWEILSRQDPYPHHSDYQTFVLAVVEDGERPPIPPGTPPRLVRLVEACWHPYPEGRPSFDAVLAELEAIIVEAALENADAQRFWLKNFPNKYQPTFTDLYAQLVSFCGFTRDTAPRETQQALDMVLELGAEREVSIERFDQVVAWFGPLLAPEPMPSLLTTLAAVAVEPWFFGNLSSQQTSARLAGEPPGTFLVRFSTQRGAFTLSHVGAGGEVNNMRIMHNLTTGYLLDESHVYGSLSAAVEALKGPMHLVRPCPGTPYAVVATAASAAPSSAAMYGTIAQYMG